MITGIRMGENRKIAVNSVIIFIRLCIVSLIGIVASRVLLQALGASDFGLYNVVGGIVTLLNVFNTAMIATTYRYIAFELGKGAEGDPNRVFCACLAIHLVFCLAIIVIGWPLGEWYISRFLNVESAKIADAFFVFRISIVTTIVTTVLVPFQGLLTAYEQFGVSAIIDIISQILRLAGIFLLLYFFNNKIRTYSLIMLLYNALYSIAYMAYCFRHYYSTVRLHFVRDKGIYKEMLSFSGWILFGATASVGKTQGSAMVVNYFFGTIVNAAFAIANQVENFILMFSRMLNNAAVPQITKNYSGGNQERSVKLASYISKYTFIFMLFAAYPVMMDMDFLLGLWLKEIPEGTSSFCKLMVLGGLLGCMGEGIPALTQASGKIKWFQIVLSTFNLSGLLWAVIAYKLGAGQDAILIIYCIIYFLSAFIRLYLLKVLLNIDVTYFIRTSYSKMFYISIPLVVLYLFYSPASYTFVQHLLGLVVIEIVLLGVVALFGFDRLEWGYIKGFLKNKFPRVCQN